MRFWLLTRVVLFGSLLAATAGAGETAAPAGAPEPFPAAYTPPVDPAEVMALDPDLLRIFETRVTARRNERQTLQQILDTLLDPGALGFVYEAHSTYDVRETLRRRRGNCVSFALCIIALCRHFGLPAYPQVIPLPSKWDRIGQHVVNLHHMNVRVIGSESAYLVDLRPDLVPAGEVRLRRVVPDARALAIFYSNVGFFQLVAGRADEAFAAMTQATQIDPTFADGWTNRGVLLARKGDLTAARAAFERSLALNRRQEMALLGLVGVLHRLGGADDLKLAAKLERRARAVRDANPYYREKLAQDARDQHDWLRAEREFKQAVRLKPDEPTFRFQWIHALRELGRTNEADRQQRRLDRMRQ